MSGIYDMKRVGDEPPRVIPVGALGDISAALYATIGILAALRHRDQTGRGQYVDIAMFDAVAAMTDIVTNLWSMGQTDGGPGLVIVASFKAKDGYFVLQVGREQHFARMCEVIGRPEWVTDHRFATREGWVAHQEDLIRPAIESWAASYTRFEACQLLSDAGLAAGPCLKAPEVIADEHLHNRNMLFALDRTDDVPDPVIIPGNPVKLSDVPELPDARPPWLGEHTDATLRAELGMDDAEITRLREAGVIR
jgi:crotonobetainyl-CoA:carnitine CoA-transferase CaiB-like acyl-CoA transferase